MRNIYNNVIEFVPAAVRTSTLTPSSGVDLSSFDGDMNIILTSSAATAGTNPTLNCKLQHSDASDSGFTDVTGVAFSEITGAADSTQMLTIDADSLKRYARVVCTIAGTNTPTFAFGVVAVCGRQVNGAPTLVA